MVIKRWILLVVSSLAILSAFALADWPVNENFESAWPPAGWNLYQLGDPAGWQYWTTNPHSPTHCAYHADNNVTTLCQDWLVLPAVTIETNDKLYFYERNYYMAYYRHHGVWISTGSGNPADGQFVQKQTYSTSFTNWIQHNLDLSEYAGQTIYIAFYYEGDYASQWAIDDVQVGQPDPYVVDVAKVSADDTCALPGTVTTFSATVHNTGTAADTYDLSTAGTTWNTFIHDVNGDALPTLSLASGAQATVYIDLEIPTEGLEVVPPESFQFIATSQGNPAMSDAVTFSATVRTPLALPYTDDFEANYANWIAEYDTHSAVAISPDAAHSGANGLKVSDIYISDYAYENVYLTLPCDAAVDPVLSFWFRFRATGFQNKVQLDLWDGTWHTNIWNADWWHITWEQVTLDLSGYDTTAPWKLRFLVNPYASGTGSSDYYFCLDDFALTVPQAATPGDLNNDGAIDGFDFAILQNHVNGNIFQGTAPFTAPAAAADFNEDTFVDAADLVDLANYLAGNV